MIRQEAMVSVTDPINQDAITQSTEDGKANRKVMIDNDTKRR